MALELGIYYLAAMTLATFLVFALDKSLAKRGSVRVPEATLLWMSFAGGWVGAKLAQKMVRHKTRKQPFGRRLNALPLTWVGILLVAAAAQNMPDNLFGEEQKAEQRTAPKFFSSVRN